MNDHLSADAILASAAENPSISDFMAAGDAPLGVEYLHESTYPGDRTYGNFVRYFIRNEFAD